jgi:2-hydroxychromene-2-carboxylate isomerase
MAKTVVSFYFGLGSRYSYLAATQLDRIEAGTDAEFEWLPLQSSELIRRANDGRSPFDGNNQSGQYDWAYRQRDAKAWAAHYGVPYKEPVSFRVDPSDLAKACWIADHKGRRQAMSWRILRAIFVEGLTMSRDVLGRLASDIGLDGAELVDALDEPDVAIRHEAALVQALEDGAFGVPTFVVGSEMLWGNDRLPLLEDTLNRLRDAM